MELAEQTISIQYDLQFFAKDGPGGEKTEPATSKKLSDARGEGQVCRSRELDQAIMLVGLFLTLKMTAASMGLTFLEVFSVVYNKIPETEAAKELTVTVVMSYIQHVALRSLKLAGPFFAAGFLIAFLSNLVQVKWKVSTKPLQPRLDKFNPLNGFKRMFSKDSLFELLKSLVKIIMIAVIAYTSVRSHAEEIFLLYHVTLNQAIAQIGSIVIDVGLKIAYVYCVVGAVDYVYQRHKFNEDMKMTKQEVKDEYKNTEGDPQIKGRQRRKMQEVSQKRMMR